MDNPTMWAVIWLAAMAGFGVGELLLAGSFFLLPFAVGSLAAAIVSLVGAPLVVSFPVFLVCSFATYLGMRPLARRMEASTPEVAGIGANRLLGVAGTVIATSSNAAPSIVTVSSEPKRMRSVTFGRPAAPVIGWTMSVHGLSVPMPTVPYHPSPPK